MDALTVLKYLGIAVAGASALWGVVKKLTGPNELRARRLTKSDMVTIGFVLAAMLISFVANYFQNKHAAQSAETAARKEAQQKPLRSLAVEWVFDRVPDKHKPQESISISTCERPFAQDGKAYKRERLYSWLASLWPGNSQNKAAILLIALDEEAANVLPLGSLNFKNPGYGFVESEALDEKRLVDLAATVEFREDLAQCRDLMTRRFQPPVVKRNRRCAIDAELKTFGSSVTAIWKLDSSCIANGIDKSDPGLTTTAELPRRITLLLLTEIGELPFEPRNFAASNNWLPWKDLAKQGFREKRGFQNYSRLKLTAGVLQSDIIVYEYEMKFHGTVLMGGKRGGAMIPHDYPHISAWVGERR